jgi:18S rRNA (guanine1575-N7)-methyltransferase
MITNAALESGFTGGIVVDYPHSSKAKKYYLFIQAGYTQESIQEAIKAIPKLEKEENENNNIVKYDKNTKPKTVRGKKKNKSKKAGLKTREWIIQKKEKQSKQGKTVRKTTKYTARKRKGHHIA